MLFTTENIDNLQAKKISFFKRDTYHLFKTRYIDARIFSNFDKKSLWLEDFLPITEQIVQKNDFGKKHNTSKATRNSSRKL